MQTVSWGKQRFTKFLVHIIQNSIKSKHSLTKLYLYILQRRALITPFWVCVKKPSQAHRAYGATSILTLTECYQRAEIRIDQQGIERSNHFLTSMRSATLERSGVTVIGL